MTFIAIRPALRRFCRRGSAEQFIPGPCFRPRFEGFVRIVDFGVWASLACVIRVDLRVG